MKPFHPFSPNQIKNNSKKRGENNSYYSSIQGYGDVKFSAKQRNKEKKGCEYIFYATKRQYIYFTAKLIYHYTLSHNPFSMKKEKEKEGMHTAKFKALCISTFTRCLPAQTYVQIVNY
jgi:hypothetical protein